MNANSWASSLSIKGIAKIIWGEWDCLGDSFCDSEALLRLRSAKPLPQASMVRKQQSVDRIPILNHSVFAGVPFLTSPQSSTASL
ncbi:MAG: hypothetical protein LDL41_18740 [Coleofasciculus sp. S288]|nr:hypothetical protein [Coleofasciculus sp. S288]